METSLRITCTVLAGLIAGFLMAWGSDVSWMGIAFGSAIASALAWIRSQEGWRSLLVLLGPLAGLLVWALLLQNGEAPILARTAGITVWMAVWWITEAVNIYFTALIPAFAFPLLGVLSMKEVAPSYLPQIIFLFIGGFLLAFALERWNLHKRIALRIILAVGASSNRILLGFMLASWFLSMWILNTATVMMLLPAVLAVVDQLAQDEQTRKKISTPFLLGLAFASSIGGVATLIGTAPNLYFMEFFNSNFPDAPPITFANWFFFGFPVSIVFLVICYLVLQRVFRQSLAGLKPDHNTCRTAFQELGPMQFEEKVIGIIFLTTVLLWFTSHDLQIQNFTIPGWINLLPEATFVKESTVAVGMAFLLLLIPSKQVKGEAILNWKEAKKIPIGVILLFGGGFAMAKGITSSGLSDWLGEQLHFQADIHPVFLVLSLCLFMTFFTELTSNTASTVLILPILQVLAESLGESPFFIMLPVVFSASFAFMLPVATPPNTLVFASDRLRIRDMMRAGIWLNLIGVLLMVAAIFTLARWLFDFTA